MNPDIEERDCPRCESLMDREDQYTWICYECGEVLSFEPDWDEMRKDD